MAGRRVWLEIGVGVAVAIGAGGSSARADAGARRVVDVQGGLVVSGAPTDDLMRMPGAQVRARYFVGPVFVGGVVSADLAVDARNVERLEPVPIAGVGVGAGVHASLAPRVTAFAGVEGELVYARGWPVGARERRDVAGAVRGGPHLALAVDLERVFGHIVALEARVDYIVYRIDTATAGAGAMRAGLFLTGTLLE